jgi:hypothetical protein
MTLSHRTSLFKSSSYFRFNVHGMPSLLEEPIPPLVHYIENNPYDDPANPPSGNGFSKV